jgi:hypothetical protein
MDDGAAAHFVGRRFFEAVSSRPKAKVYRVFHNGGRAVEEEIETHFLGVARTGKVG